MLLLLSPRFLEVVDDVVLVVLVTGATGNSPESSLILNPQLALNLNLTRFDLNLNRPDTM